MDNESSKPNSLQLALIKAQSQYESEQLITKQQSQEIERWKETSEALQAKISTLNSTLQETQNENQKKDLDLDSTNKKVKGLENRIKGLQQEYRDANAKSKAANEQILDLQKELNQLTEALQKVKSEKHLVTDKLRIAETKIKHLDSNCQEETGAKQNLLRESLKSQEEIANLRNRISQLREAYAETDSLSAELEKNRSAMATLRVQKDTIEKKRKTEVTSLESQVRHLQKELEKRLVELSEVKRQSDSYKGQLTTYKMEVKMKSADLKEKDEEYTKWYNSEREQLKRELKVARDKAAEAELQHTESVQELVKLRDELHSKGVEIQMLNEKLKEDREEELRLRLAREEATGVQHELESELARSRAASTSFEKEVEEKVIELRRHIANMEVQLLDSKKQMDEDAKEKQKLHRQIKKLESELVDSDKRAKSLEHLADVAVEESRFQRKHAEELAAANLDDVSAVEHAMQAQKRERESLRRQVRVARIDEQAAQLQMVQMTKQTWGQNAKHLEAEKKAKLFEIRFDEEHKRAEQLEAELYKCHGKLETAERMAAREKAHSEMLSRDLNKYNYDLKKKVALLEKSVNSQQDSVIEAKRAKKQAEDAFTQLKARSNETVDNVMEQLKINERALHDSEENIKKERDLWKVQAKEAEKELRAARNKSEQQAKKYQNDMKVQKQQIGNLKAELDKAVLVLEIKEKELERLMAQAELDRVGADEHDLKRIAELEQELAEAQKELIELKETCAEFLEFKKRDEERKAQLEKELQREKERLAKLNRDDSEDLDMQPAVNHPYFYSKTKAGKQRAKILRKKQKQMQTKESNSNIGVPFLDNVDEFVRSKSTTSFLPVI